MRAGLSAQSMIHFCVATNPRPLKHQGFYCYLDLKVAIGELGLKVMYSKTAQVVVVDDSVPPQAFCLTRKSPQELGSMCLPNQQDLILPRGSDTDQVPKKYVGKIFKASPMLRPRPTSRPAAAPLRSIAETDQPIVIPDDDDVHTTAGSIVSSLSGAASSEEKATTETLQIKRRPPLKVPPSSRPRAVVKSAPSTPKVPPAVERYVVPRGPAASPLFAAADFATVLPGLPMGPPPSPSAVLKPKAKSTGNRFRQRLTLSLEKHRKSAASAQRMKGRRMTPCSRRSSRPCMRTPCQSHT